MSTKKFTVLELIASLAIFSIIMVILINFFVQAQNVKKITEGISRVQANARLIFDTIENDLRHAVASREFNREIPFAIVPNNDDIKGPFPLMVATLANDAAENSSTLAEISYKVGPTEINGSKVTDADDKPVNFFKRSVTTNKGGSSSSWNFYGEREGSSAANWKNSGSIFYPIAKGVIDIECNARMPRPTRRNYIDAGTPLEKNNDDNAMCGGRLVVMDEKIIRESISYNNLPTCVDVEITLFDPNTESANNPTKTKKTFFKRIFIKQGPRNYEIED